MDKKQASIIARWLMKNHKGIIGQIGDEATHKLWQFAEGNGISLKPKRVGRPKADQNLNFIPSGDINTSDLVNAAINYKIEKASDLARLFGTLTKGGYLDPATPLKSFYVFWHRRELFPWEDDKPICKYNVFTEAVSDPRNAPTEDDVNKFEQYALMFADYRVNSKNYANYDGECYTEYIGDDFTYYDGESYTMEDFREYIKWMEQEAD